ncbi:MAG: hypothetical protein PHS10_07015 [Thiovulaceae bacterium]|nr:hypothetical protein [Sulfurimonadaceae bacterium]
MQEIKLLVQEQNVETVLTILENLKSGLIAEIQTEGKTLKTKTAQYRPKTNAASREESRAVEQGGSKYLSPAAFKQRLQAKK